MSVRNFWIKADIDGRASYLQGGPRSKDGGFSLTVTVRDEGCIARALDLDGRVTSDGHLVLTITPGDAGVWEGDDSGFTITTSRDKPTVTRNTPLFGVES